MLNKDESLNSLVKEIRLSLGLTQQEIATLAGVSEVEVDSFECSFPVTLESKNKILKILCHNFKYQMAITK